MNENNMYLNQNQNAYSNIYQKINSYKQNSYDINFHLYLDRKAREASRGMQSPADMEKEIDANYEKYLNVERTRGNQSIGHSNQGTSDVSRPYATGVIPPQYNANKGTAYMNNQMPPQFNAQYIGSTPQYNTYNTPVKKSSSNNIEFKIGAGVLSVVGAVFLLIALFSFGRYYLQDSYQGIVMYAVTAIIIILSELLLEKRLPQFAHVVTGIGIGALYFITIFCTEYLQLFNIWVALAVTVIISIIAFFLSRARKSGAIELICCVGCCALAFPFRGMYVDDLEYILYASILVLVYFAMFMAPIKQGHRAFKIVQLIALLIYGNYFLFAGRHSTVTPMIINCMAVMVVLLCFTCYAKNREDKPVKIISLIVMVEFLAFIVSRVYSGRMGEYTLIVLGVVCLVFFFVLFKSSEKWIPYSIFMITVVIAFFDYNNTMIHLLVLLGVLIISKLLSGVKELRFTDAFISICSVLLINMNTSEPLTYIFYLVLLVGAIMTVRWKLFYEFLFLYAGLAFIVPVTDGYLSPIICMTFVFAMVLVYNLIPTMRVKYIQVYNIVSMIVLGIIIVSGTFERFKFFEELAVNISALLFGCAAIIIFMTDRFKMKSRAKYLILAVFITYMSFMFNTTHIWTSVILMIAALTIISFGFIFNRIELRIYGLALSLCMCLKLALYDFRTESDLNRTIVFLVVGVVAILISLIYLILEKKEQKEMRIKEQAAAKTQENNKIQATNQAQTFNQTQAFNQAQTLNQAQPQMQYQSQILYQQPQQTQSDSNNDTEKPVHSDTDKGDQSNEE